MVGITTLWGDAVENWRSFSECVGVENFDSDYNIIDARLLKFFALYVWWEPFGCTLLVLSLGVVVSEVSLYIHVVVINPVSCFVFVFSFCTRRRVKFKCDCDVN